MLRASVSLSRKVSRDFNSTGVGVTLDGEIPFDPDDAEGVLEKVQELYDLAREALSREVERVQDEHDQASRTPFPPSPPQPGTANGHPAAKGRSEPLPMNRPAPEQGRRHPDRALPVTSAATPKQLQYLQNLGKRKGLAGDDLDAVIAQAVGSPKKLGDLTKREAGAVIDRLSNLEPEATR